MKSLNPYLTFNGNCREAMEFYRDALDGQLVLIQTYEEAPMDFPKEKSNRIFNSELVADKVRIMASDVLNEVEMHEEQRFSLFLTFSDASEQDRLFANLSNGGKVLMPIQNGFGMLRDRFEVQWMLAYEELVS